jgi:trehalose-6-phosphate synthase
MVVITSTKYIEFHFEEYQRNFIDSGSEFKLKN